ncbi:MAG: hypothetical protein JXR68_06840 [Bacteroidales bacterium]|nr:hypothetical protein [Bacteroidales bacterium]
MKKLILSIAIVVFAVSCNQKFENVDFSDKYYSVTDIYLCESKQLYDFENRHTHVVKIKGYVDKIFFQRKMGMYLLII